jgi:epoxyqueuosine reductase
VADLALLSEEEFREQIRRSPVKRAKWRGLLRNVAIALAACADPEAKEALQAAFDSTNPLVREHAQWGVEQIENRT